MRSGPSVRFSIMNFKLTRHGILFTVGLLGIIFYMVAPVAFPDATGLRQPELLPVYTLMVGLGQLLKGNEEAPKGDKGVDEDKGK